MGRLAEAPDSAERRRGVRQLLARIHPDKAPEDMKGAAHELFVEVQRRLEAAAPPATSPPPPPPPSPSPPPASSSTASSTSTSTSSASPPRRRARPQPKSKGRAKAKAQAKPKGRPKKKARTAAARQPLYSAFGASRSSAGSAQPRAEPLRAAGSLTGSLLHFPSRTASNDLGLEACFEPADLARARFADSSDGELAEESPTPDVESPETSDL